MAEVGKKDLTLPSWALELIFTSASIHVGKEKENLFADVGVVGLCSRVCKEWRAVSKSDVIWKELCAYVWDRRLCIQNKIKAIKPAIEAYRATLDDSKRRDLTLEDLTQTEGWNFRFKEVNLR
jgi:hypothetical protein